MAGPLYPTQKEIAIQYAIELARTKQSPTTAEGLIYTAEKIEKYLKEE